MTLKGLTRRRGIAAGAALAVVAAGGAVVWARQGSSASTQYRTATATLGTVPQSLSLTGNLPPLGESDLNFGSAGRVTAVNVQPGQSVTAGQVLATIDTTSLSAALTQAQREKLTPAGVTLSPRGESFSSAGVRLILARVSALSAGESVSSVGVGVTRARVSLIPGQCQRKSGPRWRRSSRIARECCCRGVLRMWIDMDGGMPVPPG